MYHRLTDFFAYRWRYLLGYGAAIVVIAVMMTIAALYIPNELRQGEIDSAITSGTLGTSSMAPEAIINFPYHLLQKLSFIVFGVSNLSIKLPSIFLGVLTVIGIFLLLRTWLHTKVAIIGTILSVVTTQFLFMSQDGTPLIMYTFITIWLLFVATFVTRRKHFGMLWKVLTSLAMAMSLYTPLGVYLVLVMLGVSVFHPHIRYLIRRLNPYKLTVAIILALTALIPLLYAIYLDTGVLRTLLGIPQSLDNIGNNFILIVKQTVGVTSLSSTYLIRPLYPLGLAMLMLVGLYGIMIKKYTARSAITLCWGVVLSIFVILNPDYVTFLFPVATILGAYGIAYMFGSWYRLFPYNPYARALGIIPLGILILAMVGSGVTRFINTYHYNSDVLANYSSDLKILDRELAKRHIKDKGATVVVDGGQLAFYRLIEKYDHRIIVTTDTTTTGPLVIATRTTKRPTADIPASIVTSTRQNDSDRFYIYTK